MKVLKSNNLIYALQCPITGETHYVGKSSQGLTRPKQHMSESHSEKVNQWVKEIGELGYIPKIKILESNISDDELNDKEKYWIVKMHEEGCLLLNSTYVNHDMIFPEEYIKVIDSNITGKYIGEISKVLKNARKIIGLTQEDFAKRMGIGLRLLRDLEQGTKDNFNTRSLETLLNQIGFRLTIKLEVKPKIENICDPEKR